MTDVVLELPDALRSELKDPMGPVFTDADELLAEASSPLLSVGDVVTYHLIEADYTPAVALVDERTERTTVDAEVSQTIQNYDGFDNRVAVSNPPATLTSGLLRALVDALRAWRETSKSTLIEVDGEEDLAALPAVVVAATGSSVVYGQPGVGMVLVSVDEQLQAEIRRLLSRMEGNISRVWELLGAK